MAFYCFGRRKGHIRVNIGPKIFLLRDIDTLFTTRRRNCRTKRKRALERQNVSCERIRQILRENLLYPYHIQRVRELLPPVYRYLFTDQAKFTPNAIDDFNNQHL